MRKSYTKQYRFDSSPIAQVELNVECRDEIICVLLGLQHLYTNSALRTKVIQLVAADINEDSRSDAWQPARAPRRKREAGTHKFVRGVLTNSKEWFGFVGRARG